MRRHRTSSSIWPEAVPHGTGQAVLVGRIVWSSGAEDRAGQHSIRINDQWRICFTWTAAGAAEIEITDYH